MSPVEFEGQSLLLGPPPGTPRGECGALPVLIEEGGTFGRTYCSYWKPSAEELAALVAGGHVRLRVRGNGHPPVSVDVPPPGYVKELP